MALVAVMAGTGSRSAHRNAHGAVLRFHQQQLGVHQAIGVKLGEFVHQFGLRRDGIGCHHMGVDLPHRLSNSLIAR